MVMLHHAESSVSSPAVVRVSPPSGTHKVQNRTNKLRANDLCRKSDARVQASRRISTSRRCVPFPSLPVFLALVLGLVRRCWVSTAFLLAFPSLRRQNHQHLLLLPCCLPHPFLPWSRPHLIARKELSSARARRERTSSARPTTTGHSTTLASTSSSSSSSSSSEGDETEWKAVLAAFKMYKAAYGNLKVPQKFVVPTLAPWPKAARGMRLGKIVQEMRGTGKYLNVDSSSSGADERRRALEDLGFVWRIRQEPATPSTPISEPSASPISSPLETSSSAISSASSSAFRSTGGHDGGVPLKQLYRALMAYRELVVAEKQRTQPPDGWEVPATFFVPDLPPWPEEVRGMPLGREFQGLNRRLSENPKAREAFKKLGIATLLAPPDPSSPPSSSSSPRVSGVGGSSGTLSSDATMPGFSSADDNTQSAMLSSSMSSANDVRFNNVYEALKTYKNLYGDLLVPQPFTVPRSSRVWPEETWGMRLGARVNAIRSQGTFVRRNPDRYKMLDELGFVWKTPNERTKRGGKNKTGAAGGDDGDEDDNPSYDSDESVSSRIGDSESMFDESFDYGTDFMFPRGSRTWGLVEGGAADFSEISASLETEPAEDEYSEPRSLADSLKEATERAMEVGVIEGMTPNKRVIKGKQQKDIPWFNDDFGDDFVFEDVVEALTIFKSIHGDFSNLTEDFTVPSPEEVTGFLNDDEDFDSLAWLDVDVSARAAAAVANYESKGDGPGSDDVIPSEGWRMRGEESQLATAAKTITSSLSEPPPLQWPEALANMQLGSIVSRIRDGSLEVKHLPERKAQLDALDFDWGNPEQFLDVPFEKAMCAFYAYYLIRGDMFVQEDFVMPDEDPWPQALAGYEIGKAVTRIRELQNFLEAYHSEKVSLLRMIDFVWFPTLALPLDPRETEMNTELLLLSAMGHPDYAKMIDIPMGLPDKIMADGPFYETDDPKLWWRKWHNWDYVKDYWYQQGRRDNAYVLRRMGYPMMADEHEAKYGPGLFTQINATLETLESGVEDWSLDERRKLLETLNSYRLELVACTDIHPQERDKMIAFFDERMLDLTSDPALRSVGDAIRIEDQPRDLNFEPVNGATASQSYDDEEDQDIEIDVDDFEINIEDELGLDIQ